MWISTHLLTISSFTNYNRERSGRTWQLHLRFIFGSLVVVIEAHDNLQAVWVLGRGRRTKKLLKKNYFIKYCLKINLIFNFVQSNHRKHDRTNLIIFLSLWASNFKLEEQISLILIQSLGCLFAFLSNFYYLYKK